MKKMNESNVKKAITKITEKSLLKVADAFSALACQGPWYEPKVPQKLKK